MKPQILLTKNKNFKPDTPEYKEITQYHHALVNQAVHTDNDNKIINQKLDIQNEKINKLGDLAIHALFTQQEIRDDIKTLLKKPKPKRITQLLRNPVPNTVLQRILTDPKPNKIRVISWERFKIMCALLYFTGLRISEIRNFTRQDIIDFINRQQIEVLQYKTNTKKTVLLPKYGKTVMKSLQRSIDTVCPNKQDILYPYKDLKKNKIIESVNKKLKPYAAEFNLNLTSHSFRAGFITQLLHKVPVHKVQQLAGHKDVRSTIRYNRHNLTAQEKINILDESFTPPKD